MANKHGCLDTLWGRIDPATFHDRAVVSHPRRRNDAKRSRRSLAVDDNGVLYKPRTQQTRAAYDALLDVINQHLGAQPPDVLAGAADEILITLNDQEFTNEDPVIRKKKKEIEKLLNAISDQTFHQLVSIGERITDFDDDDHQAQPPEDYHLGTDQFAAVEFAADSDDDDDDFRQAQGHDDTHSQSMQAVNVQDIDAYWLQRKIWHALGCIEDPQHCNNLAEEVLKVLAAEGDDDRGVENRLVVLFDYGRFDLVKFLLRNRHEIVWCTRLARAQDKQQRSKIEEEMRSDPRLAPILEQLLETRALSTK